MNYSLKLQEFVAEFGEIIFQNINKNASKDEIEKAIIRNRTTRAYDKDFVSFIMNHKDELVKYFISNQSNILKTSTSSYPTKPQILKSIATKINKNDWNMMNFMVKHQREFIYQFKQSESSIHFKNGSLKVVSNQSTNPEFSIRKSQKL